MIKAAQYIRMSTDRQDLSPAIQKEAIAGYAGSHDIEVLVSYEDLGKSGVRLANRPGLTRLLRDVAARPCYTVVLVYDVSRWGRFQDSDASAYYDYHCRLNGVTVIYVAETFGEAISPVASLLKGMKRVMAAEYSRDLAFKCVAGQERVLAMGCQMGQLPCLGYRRESVSADGLRRVVLTPGQSKFAVTDRIQWVLADDKEVALVREIFDIYIHTHCTVGDLVQKALREGWVSDRGRPLTKGMIASLLRSEVVIGNFVWGRSTQSHPRIVRMNLHRMEGAVPRIVDASTWALTQAKLKSLGWRRSRTNDELLGELKLALERNPGMTAAELTAHGCFTKTAYCKRFGSWRAALEATGIDPKRLARNRCDRSVQRRLVAYSFGKALEDALVRRVNSVHFDGHLNVVTVRHMSIRIRVLWPKVHAGGRRLWHVEGYPSIPEVGRVLFVRMDPRGIAIDFCLVDVTCLSSAFPRWLAWEVPTDLLAYWCPTRPLLLKRLASMRGQDASPVAGPGTFSAVALAHHRRRLGITARECGALIGASPQSIYRWEKGITRPSAGHIEAIARFQRLGKSEASPVDRCSSNQVATRWSISVRGSWVMTSSAIAPKAHAPSRSTAASTGIRRRIRAGHVRRRQSRANAPATARWSRAMALTPSKADGGRMLASAPKRHEDDAHGHRRGDRERGTEPSQRQAAVGVRLGQGVADRGAERPGEDVRGPEQDRRRDPLHPEMQRGDDGQQHGKNECTLLESEPRGSRHEVAQGRPQRVRYQDRRPVEGLLAPGVNVFEADVADHPSPHEQQEEDTAQEHGRRLHVTEADGAIEVVGHGRADRRGGDDQQPVGHRVVAARCQLREQHDGEEPQEDQAGDRVAQVQRHRHRVAPGLAHGGGQDLHDPEHQDDLGHLAGRH